MDRRERCTGAVVGLTRIGMPQMVEQVQGWLDANLPEQATDFGLDTIVTAGEEFVYGGDEERSQAALLIEQKNIILREILREIRR